MPKANSKIKTPETKNQRRVPLVIVYLEDEETVDYEYNESKSDVIVSNNRLIVGTIEKIKRELLDLEYETSSEEDEKEEGEQEVKDNEDSEID